MTQNASQLIEQWLSRQLPDDAFQWLQTQLKTLDTDQSTRNFDITFGMIPRELGKADLNLNADDLAAAHELINGWNPARLSVDIAARILVLLKISLTTNVPFTTRFKDIHRTADVSELLALYYGLPLYTDPETLVEHAALGLRTNIRAEFEAIAHHNPFPATYFAQNPWNNMVLKALFIGAMLEPIQGLDKRANADLARILRDYAHERWAADRAVSPELWRCIGPFATGSYLDDFQRVADTGNDTEQKAVALALHTAPASAHKEKLTAQLAKYGEPIKNGTLNWRAIADEMFENALATTQKLNTEVELTR